MKQATLLTLFTTLSLYSCRNDSSIEKEQPTEKIEPAPKEIKNSNQSSEKEIDKKPEVVKTETSPVNPVLVAPVTVESATLPAVESSEATVNTPPTLTNINWNSKAEPDNGQIYYQPIQVTLTGVEGGKIYYTLDESSPESGKLYDKPISLHRSSKIRFVIKKENSSSEIYEKNYEIRWIHKNLINSINL